MHFQYDPSPYLHDGAERPPDGWLRNLSYVDGNYEGYSAQRETWGKPGDTQPDDWAGTDNDNPARSDR